MGLFLAGIIRVRAETPHRAGLVVQHGDGSVQTQCITFPEDSISGLDVLQRSGFDLNVDAGNSMGATICRLDNEGCSFPQEDCFCQCTGSDCVYWSYWRQENGEWVYSNLGASNTKIHDGDVEGWVWGRGTTGGAASVPPNLTFAEICAVATPTDVPPAPLPSPTPTDTPTPVPSPTATDTPTPLPPTVTPTLPPTATDTPIPPAPTAESNQPAVKTPLALTDTPSPTAIQPHPTVVPSPTGTPTPSPTIAPTLPTASIAVVRADIAVTPTVAAPVSAVSLTKPTALSVKATKRLATFGALSILVILFTTVPVLLLAGAAIWWLVKKQ